MRQGAQVSGHRTLSRLLAEPGKKEQDRKFGWHDLAAFDRAFARNRNPHEIAASSLGLPPTFPGRHGYGAIKLDFR